MFARRVLVVMGLRSLFDFANGTLKILLLLPFLLLRRPWEAVALVVGLAVCLSLGRSALRAASRVWRDLERGERGAGGLGGYSTDDPSVPHAPVLYLRSFPVDDMRLGFVFVRWLDLVDVGGIDWLRRSEYSWEEAVIDAVAPLGDAVAIARPGEELPPSAGAWRVTPSAGKWRSCVRTLVERSRLVVVVLGSTPGVSWELDLLFRRRSVKALVLLPPGAKDQREGAWEVGRSMVQGLPPYAPEIVGVLVDPHAGQRLQILRARGTSDAARYRALYRAVGPSLSASLTAKFVRWWRGLALAALAFVLLEATTFRICQTLLF